MAEIHSSLQGGAPHPFRGRTDLLGILQRMEVHPHWQWRSHKSIFPLSLLCAILHTRRHGRRLILLQRGPPET